MLIGSKIKKISPILPYRPIINYPRCGYMGKFMAKK